MVDTLGEKRSAAVCRELTKKYEEVSRGCLGDLAVTFAQRDVKGEIVVVVDRAEPVAAGPETVEEALKQAMLTHSLKDAAALVADELGLPKRDVYQLALGLGAKA